LKHVFVGDIHGKVEMIEMALEKDGKIIFMGDFQDSFDRPVKDHAKCYELVLAAIDSGKAESLLGNHELSYMIPKHQCSGWQQDRYEMFMQYKNDINSKFQSFMTFPGNWLVTHAGLHPIVLDYAVKLNQAFEDDPNSFLYSEYAIQSWIDDIHSSAHWIGRYRGGPNSVGGIFWCDFKAEFAPIEGLNQIFGHTAGREIRTRCTPNSFNYCIDCLDHQPTFLELDL